MKKLALILTIVVISRLSAGPTFDKLVEIATEMCGPPIYKTWSDHYFECDSIGWRPIIYTDEG